MCINKRKISVILIIFLFINGLILFNEQKVYAIEGTEVSGIISEDTTWSKEHSPYIVKGNILVDKGATLKIQPGVEVIFDGHYYIYIKGKIIAQGNEKGNITFSSGIYKTWKEIKIESSNNKMEYCSINNSENAIHLKNESAHSNSIKNCTLTNNDVGIYLDSCKSTSSNKIQNCILAHNEIGINMQNSDNNLISNCDITQNKIGISQGVCLRKNNVKNNNIYNNEKYNLKLDKNSPNDEYDLSNNYWGTIKKEEIEKKIFDIYDDFEYAKVIYQPYLNKSNGKLKDIRIDASEISFIKKYLIINLGESKKIDYRISPENVNEIIWLTNNEKVVEVKDGVITAVGEGKAVISGTSENGNKKDECEVIVEEHKELPSKDDVPEDKIWTVKFNGKICFDEITSDNIFILDEGGKKVDVKIEKINDTSITVAALDGYKKCEDYTLLIKGVKSIDGKKLNKTMKMEFRIEGSEFNVVELW